MQAIVVKAFIIAVGVVGVVDFVGFSVPMAIRVIQNFVDYYIFSFLFVVCSLAFFPRAFFGFIFPVLVENFNFVTFQLLFVSANRIKEITHFTPHGKCMHQRNERERQAKRR